MIIAHNVVFIRPTAPETVLRIDSVLSDLASPLFALVIGVTTVLVAPTGGGDPAVRRRFTRQFAIKGLALVPIGWLLSVRPSGVDVVLDPLGITMVCAAPLLFVRSRVLSVGVVALVVLGPVLNEAARGLTVAAPAVAGAPVVSELLDWFVLGGNYRVTGLLPLLLLGIVLARWLTGQGAVRRRRGSVVLLVVGAAAFLAAQATRPLGWADAKLSGGHIDIVRDVGLAVGCYAAVVLLVELAPRASRLVLEPIAVQGRLALSVYVGHVAVLMVAWLPPVRDRLFPQLEQPAVGWVLQLGLVVLCWLAAALWWRRWGTGPVERVIGWVSGRHRPSRRTVPVTG